MADSWATSGSDLHLDLVVTSGPGARCPRAALIAALRDAIRGGRLAPGTRLPSSRSLAADLGLARNTVAGAYSELVAEGWLSARHGSGTRVAQRAEPVPPRPARRTPRGGNAAPPAPRTRAGPSSTTCAPARPTCPRSPAPRGWPRPAAH
ncbi:hypothetical protein TPA0909_11070 [Streptomyces albus]|nr:hypothetical protein TPA0909_11070 [Streptomyces albus]